jgi:hypothetical protein
MLRKFRSVKTISNIRKLFKKTQTAKKTQTVKKTQTTPDKSVTKRFQQISVL